MQKKNPTEGEAYGKVVNREQEKKFCMNSCSVKTKCEKTPKPKKRVI